MKNLIILTGLNWLLLTSTQGANLVTYWNFDEPTGSTTMYDSYGVNTGTLGSTAVSGAAGKFGNALSINRAANGAMGMTASTIGFPTGTKPYAISYWVFNPSFVPGATADEPHFAFGDAANGKENVVFNRDAFGGGKISYYNRDLVLPNGFFVNNQWQLIVVQWDGTTRKAYADGVLKASDSLGPNTSAGTIFSMGGDIQRPTYGTCSAIFDDFAVWDDALSEMEISILWNDGVGNPASVLAPPARDPRIHTAPSALFGDLRSLGPSPGSITNVLRLTNYGATKSLNIASLNLTGDNADLYAVLPPVPTMIAPGEGAQVQIVFTPSIIGGNFTAALEVASDDPGAPLTTVSLNAMVLGDPTIGVSPTRLFGDLTSLGGTPGIITNALTITNTGITRSLNISSITPTGENADLYTVLPPMPAPIPPGGQAEVAVAFSPLAAWGNFNASLEIASDDPLKPITTIVMNAVVASDPQIVLIPTNTPFGRFTYASADQIPATISRTVTVMNAGRVNPLDVTLQGVIGLDAGNYTLETANIMMTIPPGGQSNIVVTLSPGAGGEFEAALMVASSDPDLEEATLYPPLSASVRAVEPATLLAFYSFDDPLDPFKDDSGNGATITGTRGTAPVWGAATGFRGSGAYTFSAGRLLAPVNVNVTNLPLMTWGCWVRTDTLDGAVSGRPKALGNDNGGWGRVLGLDNRINTVTVPDTFRYTTFTGNDPINNAGPVRGTPAPVSTNDWTFLAATYDQVNKTVTMYVDLDASTTDDELVSVYERGGFRVGQETVAIGGHRPDSGTESWVGGIDNVFIFSGILTDAELKNLRDKGKAAYIASAPKVTDVVYNPDGTVALVWSSDPPPVNYAVLYSPDITLPISSWNVENTSVASGGFTTSYTTGTTFSQDQLFFVIRRNP